MNINKYSSNMHTVNTIEINQTFYDEYARLIAT